jgi:hypothetical protein
MAPAGKSRKQEIDGSGSWTECDSLSPGMISRGLFWPLNPRVDSEGGHWCEREIWGFVGKIEI